MKIQLNTSHIVEDYEQDSNSPKPIDQEPLYTIRAPELRNTDALPLKKRDVTKDWTTRALSLLPKAIINLFYSKPIQEFKMQEDAFLQIPDSILANLPPCNFEHIDPLNFATLSPKKIKEFEKDQLKAFTPNIIREMPIEVFRELTDEQAELLLKEKLIYVDTPSKIKVLLEKYVTSSREDKKVVESATNRLYLLEIISSKTPHAFLNIPQHKLEKVCLTYSVDIMHWIHNLADFSECSPQEYNEVVKRVRTNYLDVFIPDFALLQLHTFGDRKIFPLFNSLSIRNISPELFKASPYLPLSMGENIVHLTTDQLKVVPAHIYRCILQSNDFTQEQKNLFNEHYFYAQLEKSKSQQTGVTK